MNPNLTEAWQEELRLAMVKASADPAFREALIKNPREELEAQAGMELPDGFQPLFVNRSVDAVVIQLPPPAEEILDPRFKLSWVLCTSGLPPRPRPKRVALFLIALGMFLAAFFLKRDLGKPQAPFSKWF